MLVTLLRTALRESPWNPRKHFDEAALADLAHSLTTAGQLTPLVVRPHPTEPDAYEIAAGHRRFRAAERAGLDGLLCLVREMDDATFLEVLTIENLQREDVHPLEEADGYAQMLKSGVTLEHIAARIGKSVRYVKERLALRTLTEPMRALFLAGHLTLGHANEIAKLDGDTQTRLLATRLILNVHGAAALELVPEDGADEDEDESVDDDELVDDDDTTPEAVLARAKNGRILSLNEVKAWIRDQVRLKTDADALGELFPETAKAVAAAPRLVEITYDSWLNLNRKDAAPILVRHAWKRVPAGSCEHVTLGVHVVGPAQGQAHPVCVKASDCPIHWPVAVPSKGTSWDDEEEDAEDGPEPEWKVRERERDAKNAELTRLMPGVLVLLEDWVRTASTAADGPLVQRMLHEHVSFYDLREQAAGDAGDDEEADAERVVPSPFPLTGDADAVIRAMAWTTMPTLHEDVYSLEESFESAAELMGLTLKQLCAKAEQATKGVKAA